MNNIVVKNIFRFLILALLQVLVFNNINLKMYLIPYVYVLFILILPFETPKWLLLLSSFIMGITIDMFSNTSGIHTAACTFMAFLRPWAQNVVAARQEFEPGMQPGIRHLGFRWFFSYSIILIAAHHLLLYYLELFRLSDFLITFYRAFLNICLTLLIVMINQYLLYNPKKGIQQ